jgi:hypothetical protein
MGGLWRNPTMGAAFDRLLAEAEAAGVLAHIAAPRDRSSALCSYGKMLLNNLLP